MSNNFKFTDLLKGSSIAHAMKRHDSKTEYVEELVTTMRELFSMYASVGDNGTYTFVPIHTSDTSNLGISVIALVYRTPEVPGKLFYYVFVVEGTDRDKMAFVPRPSAGKMITAAVTPESYIDNHLLKIIEQVIVNLPITSDGKPCSCGFHVIPDTRVHQKEILRNLMVEALMSTQKTVSFYTNSVVDFNLREALSDNVIKIKSTSSTQVEDSAKRPIHSTIEIKVTSTPKSMAYMGSTLHNSVEQQLITINGYFEMFVSPEHEKEPPCFVITKMSSGFLPMGTSMCLLGLVAVTAALRNHRLKDLMDGGEVSIFNDRANQCKIAIDVKPSGGDTWPFDAFSYVADGNAAALEELKAAINKFTDGNITDPYQMVYVSTHLHSGYYISREDRLTDIRSVGSIDINACISKDAAKEWDETFLNQEMATDLKLMTRQHLLEQALCSTVKVTGYHNRLTFVDTFIDDLYNAAYRCGFSA